jgi:argininosuccinate lyase
MPHKKNPDVFELIRSHCNRLKALPNEIMMMTTNLPSGYHRDLQLLKEHLFPAFQQLQDIIQLLQQMISQIKITENLLQDKKYEHLFSVEAVNALVLQGVPFRDAYRQVGAAIENGTYQAPTQLNHTHEGSIGNLCTAAIAAQMNEVMQRFPFDRVTMATNNLLA